MGVRAGFAGAALGNRRDSDWLRLMEALIQALNTLPVSAVVLDASGTIVAVNDTWKEFGRHNGLCLANWEVGANYLKYSGGKKAALNAICA